MDLIELIQEYGSESRWVGHYHALGIEYAEDSAKSETEKLLVEIKRKISSLSEKP